MPKILIITSKADFHSDYMEGEFEKHGVDFVRLNADMIADELSLSYRNGQHKLSINTAGQWIPVSPEEITSVWYRKPFLTKFDRVHQKAITAFASKEMDMYLEDLKRSMTNAKWINHPDKNRLADNKIHQLRLAKSLGMKIPRTLVTNNPEEAFDFSKEIAPQKMIFKALSNPCISESKKTYRNILTTIVELDSDLSEPIRQAPCLFQEYIEKSYELRATVIGKKVFVAKIFSQDQRDTSVDWRRNQHKVKLRQELLGVAPELEAICVELVKNLGLIFGALDFIVTPEGDIVFLEINPNGQWLWVEKTLGANISKALIQEIIS